MRTVNNKSYEITKDGLVVNFLHGQADSVNTNDLSLIPYGYSIESRNKYNGEWFTYWTNKIYSSLDSAFNALIQIPKSDNYEFRVVTLYRIPESQVRTYKINQVLSEAKSKKEKLTDIKAWKLKKDFEYPINQINKSGSIFIQISDYRIIKSGQTQKTRNYWLSDLKAYLKKEELFEEVNLKDEKWLHPHLLKELKEKL